MNSAIVQTSDPVTLVGGGDLALTDLNEALGLAPLLVAADGGADAVLAHGHMPDAVIGDFDSLSDAARTRIPQARLHQIDEQDSTDFDKALRNIKAPLILALGFLGARIDHQLAALSALVRRADTPCILLGQHEILLHVPAKLSLDLQPGDVVSLFPMRLVTGRSTGLKWPIDGLKLAPDGRVGTSNRAVGPITLDVDGHGMLLILPRTALRAAMQAIAPFPGSPGPSAAPRSVRGSQYTNPH
ncbi:thiamine diphosphokinase [Falsiphaeobacter marinintestinus]|uniref:thiamine diphosphokinase n=1 Tax=Falsiphaeobacter marinintestinus TaxID=1492905 RepID=UPI0011B823AE|nr:thiamine diphosphokinase [Phaeobacter marinintestinus]